MTIACLGWGSLVWDPRDLPVCGKWSEDGPLLPIEFARQSTDDRLTLVLVPNYESRVRSLWTLLSVETVADAREALRRREFVPEKNKDQHIAAWSAGEPAPGPYPEIARWANDLDLDAVIWTALPPKFRNKEILPDIEQAVGHLQQLTNGRRRKAERYIRMAPLQIDTPYRRRFEAEFGWSPEIAT
jgi:hypothetical protein